MSSSQDLATTASDGRGAQQPTPPERALAIRLMNADKPSTELSARAHVALYSTPRDPLRCFPMRGSRKDYPHGDHVWPWWVKGKSGVLYGDRRLSQSLDASLRALTDRLPDAYPVITRNVTSPRSPEVKAWSVELYFPHAQGDAEMVETCAATPALALLAAILIALDDGAGRDPRPPTDGDAVPGAEGDRRDEPL